MELAPPSFSHIKIPFIQSNFVMTNKSKDNLEDNLEDNLPEVVDEYSEPIIRDRSIGGARLLYSESVARQVREIARRGLSKSATRVIIRMGGAKFEELYAKDFYEGQADMQNKIAELAMEQAEAGSVPMIMYLCKAKLGWTETNIVEHVGEVRAVVSSIAITKEEFAQKYLNSNAEIKKD